MRNAYLAFAAKRLVQAAVVILLAYVFTFVVVSILPGDPVTNVLRNPQNGFSEEEIGQIVAAQGLDRPVLAQLWTSLSGFQLGIFRVIEPDSFWATLFAAVALGIPVSAQIAEVLIANLDNESRQEYATVARGRGLGQARLFVRHLLKPSSLPVVTVVALTIGELLGGSLITETVFGRTGIGSLVQRSVSTQDLPVLQAIVSLAAVVFVLVNLIADLVYPLLDPRVKLVGGPRHRPAAADESAADASQAVTP